MDSVTFTDQAETHTVPKENLQELVQTPQRITRNTLTKYILDGTQASSNAYQALTQLPNTPPMPQGG